jgi:hypothetical protein
MTRKYAIGSGWILTLVGLCLIGFSGCSKSGGPSSIAGWRPKFLGGSAPPKGPNGETFITSEKDLPPPKFSVQQGEGVTPVESGGSILDQAPPPGTYAPGYVPVIQKVPFTELPPTQE